MLDAALENSKKNRKSKKKVEVAIFKEDRRGHVFKTRQMISDSKLGGFIEQKLKSTVVHHVVLLDTTTTNFPYTLDHAQVRFTEMGWVSTGELEQALKDIGSDAAVFENLMAKFQANYDSKIEKIIKEDQERINELR